MDRSTRRATADRRARPARARIAAVISLALALASAFGPTPVARAAPGDLLDAREAATVHASELVAGANRADFAPPADFPDRIRYFRIRYSTTGPDGEPTVASGLVIAPTGAALPPLPMLSVQHATQTDRAEAPSRNPRGREAWWASLVYATRGYVVGMPDGLGLGDGDFPFHPFLHADSEASSGIHFVKAARSLLEQQGYRLTGQLFLSGYSQGGHWTMAMHRALEATPLAGFRLAASAAMAGPFDLSETLLRSVGEPGDSGVTAYLAYALFAWQSVYGDLVGDWREALRDPYAGRIARLFDGTRSGSEVRRALPRASRDLIRPEFAASVARDPLHPWRRAAARNDVYDWTPRRPLVLVHSDSDDVVAYRHSETALARMRARGGNVHLVTLSGWGHVAAYPFAHMVAAERFERHREK